MTFQEIEVESLSGLQKHIIVNNGDQGFRSFPADNLNPAFIEFLQALQKYNDPYYLAWVEAGNNPDEFWNQSEAI
jgi:hypothetical protein